MMKWILNDQSLNYIYESAEQLITTITPILQYRTKSYIFRKGFFCARCFGNIRLLSGAKFHQEIGQYKDTNTKMLVLNWVNKTGPFWDDSREDNDDDYFEFNDVDVTDYGLGECARLLISGKPAESISSLRTDHNIFTETPLQVQHGLTEDILGNIGVKNVWSIDQLIASIERATPRPNNWNEALNFLDERFDKLYLSPDIRCQLASQPYSTCVVDRLDSLFHVLQSYIESRGDDGRHTALSNEILCKHFKGDKAWFSDESASNRADFSSELTFKDPFDPTKNIFASFHGKIKTPQYRVHFPWPITAEDTQIKILYIGPKITKS